MSDFSDYNDDEELQQQIDEMRAGALATQPTEPVPQPAPSLVAANASQPPVQGPQQDVDPEKIMRDYILSSGSQSTIDRSKLDKLAANEDDATFKANLGKGFNTIGSALGTPGEKVDQSFYEGLQKQSQRPYEREMILAKNAGRGGLADAYKKVITARALGTMGQRGKGLEIAGGNLALKKEGQAMRGDKEAASAAGKFDTDPIIQEAQKRQNQIALDYHTLKSAKMINPQIWAELNMGLANAINGGKTAAQGTIHELQFNTLQGDYDKFVQKFTGRPQDLALPEARQMLMDIYSRLHEAYQNQMSDRAGNLGVGREYKNTPQAREAVSSKMKQYSKKESLEQGLARHSDKPGDRKLVRNQYNKALNKTRLTYSDGSVETVDGKY